MIFDLTVLGMLETNCYILGDEETKEAVVIDPGDDGAGLARIIDQRGLNLKYILLTHGHFDHCMGASELKVLKGGAIMVHKDDLPVLKDTSFAGLFGFLGDRVKPEPDGFIKEGERISFGKETLRVLKTPGHTPGSVSFELLGKDIVIVGDTLFAGSIGRTDFPGGDYDTLIDGVREKLFPLGDKVVVFPGHGPKTTIGNERRYNPFFR